MPDVHAPPEEWSVEVAAIAAWATPQETGEAVDVSIGCIVGQPATGKSRFLPWWLWSAATERDPDTLVIYAADDLRAGRLLAIKHELRQNWDDEEEKPEFTSDWHTALVKGAEERQPRPPRHELAVGSYTAVGRMFRGNLDRLDPQDPRREHVVVAEKWGCVSDRLTLPARIVLVVDLEPSWPASLAFLLTAALSWALPEGWTRSPATSVRIVTVSSDRPPTRVTDLFMQWRRRLGGDGRVTMFAMPGDSSSPPPYERCVLQSVPEGDVAALVEQATAAATSNEPQAIVTWSSTLEFPDIDIFRLEKPPLHHVSDARERDELLAVRYAEVYDKTTGTGRKHQRIMYHVPGSALMPAHLRGYSAVHLVLPSARRIETIDHVSGLPVSIELTVSREERLQMLSWAGRSATDLTKVFIYLVGEDGSQLSAERWAGRGAMEQRMLVAGLELEGFMAALLSLQGWMARPSAVAGIFSRSAPALKAARQQLEVRGIATWLDRPDGDCTIRGRLPKDVYPVFLDCLQLLRYDARLALLAATPSSTVGVAKAKCKLASMLAVGMHSMMRFRPSEDVDRGRQYEEVLSMAGSWLPKDLISSGHVWACLGLWSATNARHYDSKEARPDGHGYATKSGSVFATYVGCIAADTIHDALLAVVVSAAPDLGIKVPDKLKRGEYEELQTSLLSAYANHLLVVRVSEWNGGKSTAHCYSAPGGCGARRSSHHHEPGPEPPTARRLRFWPQHAVYAAGGCTWRRD